MEHAAEIQIMHKHEHACVYVNPTTTWFASSLWT